MEKILTKKVLIVMWVAIIAISIFIVLAWPDRPTEPYTAGHPTSYTNLISPTPTPFKFKPKSE